MQETASADEMKAKKEAELKFQKRKLRISACRDPAQLKVKAKKASERPAKHRTVEGAASAPSMVVPKGDPLLGDRLKTLSKEARKEVKAGDEARLARRLAKKAVGKAKASAGAKDGKERIRKRTAESKGGVKGKGGRKR